jgi:hypothetical protein
MLVAHRAVQVELHRQLFGQIGEPRQVLVGRVGFARVAPQDVLLVDHVQGQLGVGT